MRSNRNSPTTSGLLPDTVCMEQEGDIPMKDRGKSRKSGVSHCCLLGLHSVILTVLSVAVLLLWLGRGCPYHTEHRVFVDGRPHFADHWMKDREESEDVRIHLDTPHRARREIDEDVPYVPLSQYTAEMAALQQQKSHQNSHPAARFALRNYIPNHEIATLASFHWEPMRSQTLFNVTPSGVGHELIVNTSGYHSISLTITFNGRTTITRFPSCSVKVASKSISTTTDQIIHNSLIFLTRTQDQMGLRMGHFYPVDTAHASGVFLLQRGDVIHVRPGTWSLGCQVFTDPAKTHLDAFLIHRTTTV